LPKDKRPNIDSIGGEDRVRLIVRFGFVGTPRWAANADAQQRPAASTAWRGELFAVMRRPHNRLVELDGQRVCVLPSRAGSAGEFERRGRECRCCCLFKANNNVKKHPSSTRPSPAAKGRE
jgi:hypothetical protein